MPIIGSSKFTMAYCSPRVFSECVDIDKYVENCCSTQADTSNDKVVVTMFTVEAENSVKPHSAFGNEVPTSAWPDYAYLLHIRNGIEAAVKPQSSSWSFGRKNKDNLDKNKKNPETLHDLNDLVKSCVRQTHDLAAGVKRTKSQAFDIPDELQVDLTKITSPWTEWKIDLDQGVAIAQVKDHLITSIRSPSMPGGSTGLTVNSYPGRSECDTVSEDDQSRRGSSDPLLIGRLYSLDVRMCDASRVSMLLLSLKGKSPLLLGALSEVWSEQKGLKCFAFSSFEGHQDEVATQPSRAQLASSTQPPINSYSRMSQSTASSTSLSLAGQRVRICCPRAFGAQINAGRYSERGITSYTEGRSLTTTLTPWTDEWSTSFHGSAVDRAIPDYTYLSKVFTDLSDQMAAPQIDTGLLSNDTKFRGGSSQSLVNKLRQVIVAAHRVDDDSSHPEWHTITKPGKIPDPLTFSLKEADDVPSHDGEPQPLEWVVKMTPFPVDFTRLEIPQGDTTVRIDIDLNHNPTIVPQVFPAYCSFGESDNSDLYDSSEPSEPEATTVVGGRRYSI